MNLTISFVELSTLQLVSHYFVEFQLAISATTSFGESPNWVIFKSKLKPKVTLATNAIVQLTKIVGS